MTYKWDPEDYNKHSAAQRRFADELIAQLHLRGDERVLDIGCGDGKISASIARLVPKGSVVGVDSSPDMIEYARSAFPPDENPNLSFAVEDASRLPYRGEFDVVFSTAALHWVRDHRPVLAGIQASLKPGGRLLIQMGGAGNAAEIIQVAERLIAGPEWQAYFKDFTFPYGFYAPDQYTRWGRDAGLAIDRAALVPKDVWHADRAALEGWFRTTWLPYLDRLPERSRARFVNQVIDAYIEANPADAAGAVLVKMVRLEVAGHKPDAA